MDQFLLRRGDFIARGHQSVHKNSYSKGQDEMFEVKTPAQATLKYILYLSTGAFKESKTWIFSLMQMAPTSEILSTEHLADHTASPQIQSNYRNPPAERWSGEAAAEKHQPLLHKASSKFVQSKQFLSSSARLTLLIGWMCDVVLLERLSWTARLQRHHLKVIHWAEFLTSSLISSII